MPRPSERDFLVVQERLAELYASLTPAQQEVLDTIMAAGLSFVDDDDLSGYVMSGDTSAMQAHMQYKMDELREEWRRANPPAAASTSDSGTPRARWNLKPLMDWFNRSEPRPA